MLFIAHRGFRASVPENSLAGFSLAARLGMDFIEFDIHLTKDKHIIVHHDETINRGTTGRGTIGKLTYADLQQVTLVDASGNEVPGEKIPLLTDVLRTIPAPVQFMIELKGRGVAGPATQVIEEMGVIPRVVFSGRDLAALEIANEAFPETGICLNITSCKEFSTKDLLQCPDRTGLPLPFSMISLRASQVTREFISACHAVKALALAWDFISPSNPHGLGERLVAWGIDGLLLDDPSMLERVN